MPPYPSGASRAGVGAIFTRLTRTAVWLLALRARDSAGVVDVLICFEQESVIAKEALRVATLARIATQFKTSCAL